MNNFKLNNDFFLHKQMKLALVFLLAFVATSYQQRFQYRMPWKSNNYDVDDSYYQPRRFPDAYYNDYYSNPLARQQPFVVIILFIRWQFF